MRPAHTRKLSQVLQSLAETILLRYDRELSDYEVTLHAQTAALLVEQFIFCNRAEAFTAVPIGQACNDGVMTGSWLRQHCENTHDCLHCTLMRENTYAAIQHLLHRDD